MLVRICLAFLLLLNAMLHADTPREIVSKAILTEDSEEQVKLISELTRTPTDEVAALLTQWKEGGIYIFEGPNETRIPIVFDGPPSADTPQPAHRFDNKEPLKDDAGAPLRLLASDLNVAETDSALRLAMKGVLDLNALSSPDLKRRLRAIEAMGMEQDPERLPVLREQEGKETASSAVRAIREAIALIELTDERDEVRITACRRLGELTSIASKEALAQVRRDAVTTGKLQIVDAVDAALVKIDAHISFVNTAGTVFRGISSGSILLVVAIGLAVTFGLMGIINMAHGEMIAIGAYTTYVVQCAFGEGLALSPFNQFTINIPGMHARGGLYDCYFAVAVPLSFLTAALAGIILERGVIRFLYRRPLESLLATWGVSLILQQSFRLVFGANNVQVASPSWLSGNWTVNDIGFNWNRLFVIGFAIAIVIGLTLLFKKTSLGLLIRSVMQNRSMAACMGVRTERVNMFTFALGSGMAGLAGAFISQISNVGPSMGQTYIVDSFMTVVLGGVGSLLGTVISALGIGLADQSLQQILKNPVLGKILVLGAIILFLQWRPSGIFVTRTRSLEG